MVRSLIISILVITFASDLRSQKIITIGLGNQSPDPQYQLKGSVYSADTGDPIIGATIFIEKHNIGTVSDQGGDYSLSLYQGTYFMRVTAVGYNPLIRRLNLLGPGNLNFPLREKIIELDEVVLNFNKDVAATNNELGTEYLEISKIKSLPLIGGEVNVLNSLTLLPGVSSQGEAAGGLNVRGGSADQNLVLLGGATLYNPFHLFGFFSGFNASVVRDVALHKGVVPANYGGRASSVIDISYKKGNFNHWLGDLTLGTTASKFSARGPVIEGKLAAMVAGRIAYPNWLLKQAKDPNVANSTASFFDSNIVLSYSIDSKNSLEYSNYLSGDSFQFPDEIENRWSNKAQTLKWNSELRADILFDLSAIRSVYTSNLVDDTPFNGFDLERSIIHNEFNLNINYLPNEFHELIVGAQWKALQNKLGQLVASPESAITSTFIDPEDANESAIYLHHEWKLSSIINLSYGMRYSTFSYLGPGTINVYAPNSPRRPFTVIDTQTFGNESIQTYNGFEPRVAAKLQLSPSLSIKGGYSKMYQYIHQLTNTTSISPTDSWKLSDSFISPQITTQYSLGLFKNFRGNRIETSIQGFYKHLENLPVFKDGADIFMNENIETEIIGGSGKAYGVEVYANKSVGKVNGWLSYTYSRSLRNVSSTFFGESINSGSDFPSNFDRPHNLSTTFNYRLGKNAVFSSVFNYSSGSPFTLPEGKFEFNGQDLPFYQERNNVRAPDIHRLDVSLQFSFESKKKIWAGQWTASIYNLYGRKNPFSVFFQDFPGSPPQAYQLSIVGSPFPSLSYELQF